MTTSALAAYGPRGTAAASAGAGTASADEIKDRFLTLLVTQLRNQDPLNPLDNAQVTTQLSQISTVNGIDKLNGTMTALADSLRAGQAMSASDMIGRAVMTPGSVLPLAGGRASGAIDLAEPADRVTLTVTGAAGNLVRTLDLGARPAGRVAFEWDGRTNGNAAAADGSYSYRVEAERAGKPVKAATFSVGTVTGIGLNGTDASVSVRGVGDVALSDIRRIQQ